MRTFKIRVDQVVEVKLDETNFDEKFMREFREVFYHFDTLEEHAEHIAQLYARNMLNYKFTEGYGPLAEMGIEADSGFRDLPFETEVLEPVQP